MVQIHIKTWLILLLTAGTCIWPPCSQAASHQGKRYGYHVTIPADWTAIPSNVIEEMARAVRNPNSKNVVIMDAAFQPVSQERWFKYPYVIVQVIPYANYGVTRQVNEGEFEGLIKAMTGMNLDKAMDSALSSDARSIMSDPSIDRPQLDKKRRRFLVSTNMTVAGSGKVRGLIAGYFGRESLVQVCFYATEKDWNRHISTGRSIVDSFRFDPAKDYSVAVAAANPTKRSIWSGVGEKALTGALMAVVVGLISGIASINKKPKSTDANARPNDAVR